MPMGWLRRCKAAQHPMSEADPTCAPHQGAETSPDREKGSDFSPTPSRLPKGAHGRGTRGQGQRSHQRGRSHSSFRTAGSPMRIYTYREKGGWLAMLERRDMQRGAKAPQSMD